MLAVIERYVQLYFSVESRFYYFTALTVENLDWKRHLVFFLESSQLPGQYQRPKIQKVVCCQDSWQVDSNLSKWIYLVESPTLFAALLASPHCIDRNWMRTTS